MIFTIHSLAIILASTLPGGHEAYNAYQQQNRHPPYQPPQQPQSQQPQQQRYQPRVHHSADASHHFRFQQPVHQPSYPQRHAAQQTHPNRVPFHPAPPPPQHQQQSPNSVTSADTYYPSYPHPSYSHSSSSPTCDMPPDLWCDSPQAAQSCGVQRQCDALKRQHKPLRISLMYEALCPYCQKFIANQLGTIVNQFRGQFELELVPWGNGRIARDGSFSCNHGQKECDANRLQSCVIDILGTSNALPFIICFERTLGQNNVESSLSHCSAFVRSQYRQIRHCFDSNKGIQLQRAAAHKTMSTRPNAIVEVPYIVINDYTPDVDANNLNIMMLPQLLAKWVKLYRK